MMNDRKCMLVLCSLRKYTESGINKHFEILFITIDANWNPHTAGYILILNLSSSYFFRLRFNILFLDTQEHS